MRMTKEENEGIPRHCNGELSFRYPVFLHKRQTGDVASSITLAWMHEDAGNFELPEKVPRVFLHELESIGSRKLDLGHCLGAG